MGIRYSNGKVLSDLAGHLNTTFLTIEAFFRAVFSPPFEYRTNWQSDTNLPFEYQTSLVFRCLLYSDPVFESPTYIPWHPEWILMKRRTYHKERSLRCKSSSGTCRPGSRSHLGGRRGRGRSCWSSSWWTCRWWTCPYLKTSKSLAWVWCHYTFQIVGGSHVLR